MAIWVLEGFGPDDELRHEVELPALDREDVRAALRRHPDDHLVGCYPVTADRLGAAAIPDQARDLVRNSTCDWFLTAYATELGERWADHHLPPRRLPAFRDSPVRPRRPRTPN